MYDIFEIRKSEEKQRGILHAHCEVIVVADIICIYLYVYVCVCVYVVSNVKPAETYTFRPLFIFSVYTYILICITQNTKGLLSIMTYSVFWYDRLIVQVSAQQNKYYGKNAKVNTQPRTAPDRKVHCFYFLLFFFFTSKQVTVIITRNAGKKFCQNSSR